MTCQPVFPVVPELRDSAFFSPPTQESYLWFWAISAICPIQIPVNILILMGSDKLFMTWIGQKLFKTMISNKISVIIFIPNFPENYS
jgi:hypothetical protein